jgi:hypothetical protein
MQNPKPTRRTSAAILIHDNATEAASRRSTSWMALFALALIVWIWLGQADTHSVFFVLMGLTTLGVANSVMAWYRMRRYAAGTGAGR